MVFNIEENLAGLDNIVLGAISDEFESLNRITEMMTVYSRTKNKGQFEELCDFLQTQTQEARARCKSTHKKNVAAETSTKNDEVKIKLERITSIGGKPEEAPPIMNDIKNETEMLPPSVPKKRGRKKKDSALVKVEPTRARSTRTKKKKEPSLPLTEGRNSDVVIEEQQYSIISIVDDEERNYVEAPKSTRLTRNRNTKQNTDTNKRTRSQSEEEIKPTTKGRKRTKLVSDNEEKEESLYQDALTEPTSENTNNFNKKARVILEPLSLNEVNSAKDGTFIFAEKIGKEKSVSENDVEMIENAPETIKIVSVVNETINLEKPMDVTRIINKDVDANIPVDPVVIQKKIKNTNLPIFNTFENSPVKKRVEAFEKFSAQVAADAPTRMTRTKKKQQQAAAEIAEENGKTQTKTNSYLTPISNKIKPIKAMSTSSSKSSNSSVGNIICPPATLSALKASHKSFAEREARRKQKEADALKNREAQLRAQIEEKRIRREKKELKVKQQREEIERERLEALRQKELKQQQEKQERLMKREEAEKRRLILKQEEKKRLEAQREEAKRREDMEKKRELKEKEMQKQLEEKEKQKQLEEKEKQKQLDSSEKRLKMLQLKNKHGKKQDNAIYMVEKAPYLPSYDCYDTDSEEKTNRDNKPMWARSEKLHVALRRMMYIDKKITNTLFCLQPQTPDLQEIFENIDPKMLKRNSSAIWNSAPRFTLMPNFEANLQL